MSSNVPNTMPYLRTTRQFPTQDMVRLQNELQRAWTESANVVNRREIAIYDLVSVVTGQQWFADQVANMQENIPKRQTLRQVYQISDAALTFSHNLKNVTLFTKMLGGFTDGTTFYPLPYVDPTPANQVGVKCTSTQVIITKGGSAPAISSGVLVLEFLVT